jgi:addiction module HigA family antidote
MIVSFRDAWLGAFFIDDIRLRNIRPISKSGFSASFRCSTTRGAIKICSCPPATIFEKLRGRLKGFHSIRVKSQWRLVVQWDGMQPIGLTQGVLAKAMGVQRKHVNELCNDRRNVTAPTALILARVFGNSPEFWLNVQRRTDLWEAMNSPRERERIKRARPIRAAA